MCIRDSIRFATHQQLRCVKLSVETVFGFTLGTLLLLPDKMLNVFDLTGENTRVVGQLACKQIMFVFAILLQEVVVLVEDLDCFVDLQDFARLDVLKVDLELLLVHTDGLHLLAQVA